jgi:outer membrane protein assembly factor BamB
VDPRRGAAQWTKAVGLKLRNPTLPWTYEIARNITFVAAWTEDETIKVFDIYGRDAWETKDKGYLGVATLGEGFVSARGSKVVYLERQTGKASEVADLGAPISAPLVVLPEGEVVALTGDFLVGINLDAPGAQKVIFRHRIETMEGLEPMKPQILADSIVVGSRALPVVIKTEVSVLDPGTLSPRWKTMLPGRVRSHEALQVLGEEIRVSNRIEGAPDRVFVLRAKDGQVISQQQAVTRRNCYHGTKLVFCVTPKAATAYDRASLAEVWSREMLDDVTGNNHLAVGDVFYIAEGAKVVGISGTGQVSFSFEIKAPPFRPKANRILGLVDGTLVMTVADWISGKGMAQVWGVDLQAGKLKWSKALTAPAFSETAVALVGDRVIWSDPTFVSACRASTGVMSGRWPHLLKAPPTRIPAIGHVGDAAYVMREGKLAFLNPKTGQVQWRADVGAAQVVAAGATHFYVKSPGGEIRALENKKGKESWKISWDPTLTPKVVEAPGGTILSHHDRAIAVDTTTGQQKSEWKPGGWHLGQAGDAPVMVRVVTFRPKAAGLLEVVAYQRDGQKVSRSWKETIPHAPKDVQALDPTAQGSFPWFHATSDLVLLPQEGGRCLSGLDLMEGKQRWRKCDLAWLAPPQAYGTRLYMATGPMRPGVPEERQGLFSIDTGSGEAKQLFKVPRQGEERFMWPQYGAMFGGQFFVLTQGDKLRQLLLSRPLDQKR